MTRLLFAIALIVSLVPASCSNEEPDPVPPLEILSVKAANIELTESPSPLIPVSSELTVTFNTLVDQSTIGPSTVSLKSGAIAISVDLNVQETILTIKPQSNLSFGSEFNLSISGVKSTRGAELSTAKQVIFKTEEPQKIYFYLVIASPTDSESITLKNNSGSDLDISSWTIGDLNNPTAYKIPMGTIVKQAETKTFPHTTIGFAINDSSETLYLKTSTGESVDIWTN